MRTIALFSASPPSFRFPHQTMLVHDHDGLQVAGETHRCYEHPACGVVLPRQPRLALWPPLSVPRKTPYGRWEEIRIGSARGKQLQRF